MENNSAHQSDSSQGQSLRERYFVAAVLFITAVTYLGTLQFGFVYDDDPQILHNPFVKSWGYVPQYFVSSVWKQLFPLVPGNYYRPLFLLWIRLNYAAFGLRGMGWHLTAVLLHVLVTWLVYCVIKRLTGRVTVAWLTALIFGVHPIHHEVVAWISGTTESLFAAMFLVAFLAYLKSLESSKTVWMLISAVFYGLALLSKETAIVLPALVFAAEWIARSSQEPKDGAGIVERFGRALLPVAFYIPIAAAYLLERNRILSGLGHAHSSVSVSKWLLTLPSILVMYVKHWLFPVKLSEFYDLFYQSRVSLSGVVLPALVLAAIAVAIWRLRNEFGGRATAYAAVWVVIPLLPALDTFVFTNGELVHDRYFYVPSIGAALLVALLVDWALAGRHVVFGEPSRVVAAGLVLASVLGLCAVREASYWLDDFTMYSRGHQIAPLNPSALNNLGAELIIRGETDTAQTLLESGYHEFPGDERFIFNLGRLNYKEKQYSKSEEFTSEAIGLDPISADSFILLGQIQLKQDKPKQAVQSFRHAVELNPYDPTYHTSYGIVLKMVGDCAGANTQFNEALALSPTDAITHIQMLGGCRAAGTPSNNPSTKSN